MPRIVPFGPTTRRRQLLAAGMVMAGAVPIGFLANSSYARPPRVSVAVVGLGVVALLGWLIDGRRYFGGGISALAVGAGVTIAREAFVEEYATVFGLLSVALFAIDRVNRRAVTGCAGFLLYAATHAISAQQPDWTVLPRPLVFGLILFIWGGAGVRSTLRVPSGTGFRPFRARLGGL